MPVFTVAYQLDTNQGIVAEAAQTKDVEAGSARKAANLVRRQLSGAAYPVIILGVQPAESDGRQSHTTPRRHSIQIAFTQYDTDSLAQPHRWLGRPLLRLEDIYDRQHDGAPLEGWYCKVFAWNRASSARGDYMSYELVTDGGHMGGRRHRAYTTLELAQAAARKWAARRFYTITEE